MVNTFEISLDKISIVYHSCSNFDLNSHFLSFCQWRLLADYEEERFDSYKIGFFRYNYTYKRRQIENEKPSEEVFYVGICQNLAVGGETEKRTVFKVEWNPNKTTLPRELRNWMMTKKLYMKYSYVQKCDIALDFQGLDISDLRYNTIGNTMVYGTPTDKTYYIRPSAGHGRIKIYDKKKERAKLGIEIPQTLRVEMTMKKPLYHEKENPSEEDWVYIENVCRMFSEIYLPTNFVTRQDDLLVKHGGFDEIYLWALRKASQEEREQLFSLMSSRTRAKYRAALLSGDYQPIQIDTLMFCEVTSKMINDAIYMVPSAGGVKNDSYRFSQRVLSKLHAQKASRDYYLGVSCESEKSHTSRDWFSVDYTDSGELFRRTNG